MRSCVDTLGLLDMFIVTQTLSTLTVSRYVTKEGPFSEITYYILRLHCSLCWST